MSFYGKLTEPNPDRKLRRYGYIDPESGASSVVGVHDIFFYESGHVGFWKDTEDGERTLVLAVKALDVWEETE